MGLIRNRIHHLYCFVQITDEEIDFLSMFMIAYINSKMLRQISKPTTILANRLNLGFFSRWVSTEPRKKFAVLWGIGDFRRLRHGSLNSQWKPVVCSAFDDQSLHDVVCGGAHTLFLTESGRVYASGLNDFGQLGIPNDISYATGNYISGLILNELGNLSELQYLSDRELLGASNQYLPKIIAVFAKVLCAGKDFVTDQTVNRMINLLRQLQPAALASTLSSLQSQQQLALQSILS